MLVVEVDVVDAEPLQRRVARAADVLGPAVDAEPRAVRRRARCRTWSRARPRRGGRAIARPTSSSLVNGPYMSAVSRKSTPRSSARWIVAIDSASSRAAVELGHPHAAEPDRGNHGTAAAKLTSVHDAKCIRSAFSQQRGPRRFTASTTNPMTVCARRVSPSGYRRGKDDGATKSPA